MSSGGNGDGPRDGAARGRHDDSEARAARGEEGDPLDEMEARLAESLTRLGDFDRETSEEPDRQTRDGADASEPSAEARAGGRQGESGLDSKEAQASRGDVVTRGTAKVTQRLSAQADLSRQRGAYNGAVEAIFAILIATGAGYWADQQLETSPRWLIVGAVIGFAAFVLRIVRMRELLEEPEPGDETRDGDGDSPS